MLYYPFYFASASNFSSFIVSFLKEEVCKYLQDRKKIQNKTKNLTKPQSNSKKRKQNYLQTVEVF